METTVSPLVKVLKKSLLPYRGERLLLAFSGGLDSAALGHALHAVASGFKIDWALAHCHHGPTKNVEQAVYRDQALAQAEQQAKTWNVHVYTRQSPDVLLEGEAAMREFRYAALNDVRREIGAVKILTAHHRDDLLETRLMRLVRGTGPQGLRAMELDSAKLLRPWLEISRADIEAYAKACGVVAVDDPSNKNSTYLRNWIRNEWLPQLEQKQGGSLAALARSLEHLAAVIAFETRPGEAINAGAENVWDRREFRDLSAFDRKALVAEKLRQLGAQDFSNTHIEEIVKRLDTVQKRLDFAVAGVEFRLNAQQIHSYSLARR